MLIKPNPAETQSEFSQRCHAALAGEFPDTSRRNAVCFDIWRNARSANDKLERIATERFSPDKFERVRDVPVFAEHTTKRRNADGQEVTEIYDRAALQAIVDRCNERIEDTGDFSPIVAGHTPDKDEQAQGMGMPDVLGYSGPFRLGMIGDVHPRWAIFCDEWHHNSDRPRLEKLRRRSPEVWLEAEMRDRFFDPIAALGAECPRLDMGLTRFCRNGLGKVVEKYSAMAPGPASVFVPSDKYQSQDTNQGSNSMLSPEDLEQIVAALTQTDAWQWVESQMNAAAPDATAGGEELPVEPAPAPEAAAPMEPPVEPPPAAGPPAGMPEEDPSKMGRYEAGDDDGSGSLEVDCDDEKKNYMAEGSAENEQLTDGGAPSDADVADPALMKFGRERTMTERQRYARLERENQEIKRRLATTEGELSKTRREKRLSDRYSRLVNLSREYSFDPDEELTYCGDFPDAQYEAHENVIRKNYQRLPVNVDLYAPPIEQDPSTSRNPEKQEKYRRETAAKAEKETLRRRDKGEDVSYKEVLEEIRSGRTAS